MTWTAIITSLCLWTHPMQPPGTKTVELNGHKFTLPMGMEVSVAAKAPLLDRPVHADFDEQGRLYVADSSGSNDKVDKQLQDRTHRIVRLEDTNGDGVFDRRTVFADRMMFPEGACWFQGSLYVAAPPSIWKLTDTDGDGVADQRTEWFLGKTLTGCANDLHGPYVGPDGWIYWCKGAFAEQTYPRPGQAPLVTRAAHIFRCRPDGSEIEPVMTGGMDNPVEVIFTPGGERIFTTTFFMHPRGVQRDGLVHAIYGGVYGKPHDVIEGHPRTGELMPVLAHFGAAAPAGLARTRSAALGEEYQDNLFAAQFSPHKISRHMLQRRGATFESHESDFLVSDNLDFHPTDVLEDADGSLIVLDTGGWYKLCCPSSQLSKPDMLGAIYRIRRSGSQPVTDPRGLKIAWDQLNPTSLASLLSDVRPAVAERASRELSRRGDAVVPALKRELSMNANYRARIQAVWALTRIRTPLANEALVVGLSDSHEDVRQAAIHGVSVERVSAAIPKLTSLLTQPSEHNRRAAAEALGRLKATTAIPQLLQVAGQENDRVLEHSIMFALIDIAAPQATRAGLTSQNPRVLRTTLIALDQLSQGGVDPLFVAPLLSSKTPLLKETAVWLVDRHPDWGGPLATFLRQRLSDATLTATDYADLSQLLARLAKDAAVQKLLVDAVAPGAFPAPVRQTALAAMANSQHKLPPDGWELALVPSLQSGSAEESKSAVAVARMLSTLRPPRAELRDALMRLVDNSQQPETLRLEALSAAARSLPKLDSSPYDFVLAHLQPDTPISTRLAAAEIFSKVRLSTAQLSGLTDPVRKANPIEIERLLESFVNSPDAQVRPELAAALLESPALTAVRPETLQKLFPANAAGSKADFDRVVARQNAANQKQRERLEQLLQGVHTGDVRRGQIVFNSQKAACATCHKIGYRGGEVGPNLTKIGQIRSDRDLLESIVFPNASFVRSFEPVTVATLSGKVHGGILKGNGPDGVVLQVSAVEEVRIAREQIDEILPGNVSVMPAGLDQQLSPQDLADLVNFLRACR